MFITEFVVEQLTELHKEVTARLGDTGVSDEQRQKLLGLLDQIKTELCARCAEVTKQECSVQDPTSSECSRPKAEETPSA